MSYGLSKDFERTSVLLAARSKNFWLRIGSRLDPEEVVDPANRLLLRLCRAVAADHGWPDEELIIQRASNMLSEGSMTESDLGMVADLLGERPDADPEKVVQELIAPVRAVLSSQLSRAVIDRYKNGGVFGQKLLEDMDACDRLGSPVAEVEIASSEFGEDTETTVLEAPTGRKILTGIYEVDSLFKGGWPLGTLLTLLMDSKVGKSMTACYLVACAILQGENAGYLSLELPKSEIHKRVLAAVVGTAITDLEDPRILGEALRYWKELKRTGRIGRLFIEKLEAGTVDTNGMAAWFRHQEKVHDARIRYRVVDYGDLITSPRKADADDGYNRGKTVWQAMANMAQDPEAPNWVLSPTQSKRPDFKLGQPIPVLTRKDLSDSVHKVRITDFLISGTPQPDIRASAGFQWYIDADRFLGKTGELVGPVPHFMAMGRMADMSHITNKEPK